MKLQGVIAEMKERKKKLRCQDLSDYLTKLGFIVRDGKRGGHKVFAHKELTQFGSGSFNCGHGKNPEIKPVYVTKIIKIL